MSLVLCLSFILLSASTVIHFVTDVEGMTAQIIIDANDGVQGVIEWQRTRLV